MKSLLLQLAGRTALLAAVSCAGFVPASAQAPQHACAAPEYRQFNFWIGDWDAFDAPDPKTSTAHVRVESILDGCVLKETYEGTNGSQGQSLSIYDQSRGVWHQTWVTNRGRLLTLEGKLEGGAIVLIGSDRTVDGKERKVRGIWKAEAGGARERADTSMDNGATWTPWFDLIFRPRVPGAH